ncbi:MAG: glycerol-3-phosphate 1-O-acyltransferase PlsY [Caldisericia bacterium]|nr:glycerol-3-phosphate 1-O-acyltransferase PlsY [Caldisericia bacterium]
MNEATYLILFAFFAYIFGSIPFGYLIALGLRKIDIREKGSGNIGATNITRVLGIKWGIIAFLLDASKGIVPFVICGYFLPEVLYYDRGLILLVSSLSIVGHDFSCFLDFKGGKGMSTLVGLLFIFDVNIALLTCAVWLIVLFVSGYVSLASVIASLSMVVWCIVINPSVSSIVFACVLSIITLWQHRGNIQRLFKHTEKVMFKNNFFGIKN